ncbi:response regulator containing a CheY-like receiver domain and an HTH DNA-binding domain [Herbaspirillum sp. CF444]|uniref:response regulator n=1 Tax=Herbaspirillum sp. CF444 TaxID=1144319 RepID=UPI0002727365|nr:response regulator transcription factor [Herbaspirillum sp. CF444]EJL92394.1 response regulator containing a CheY-like receiver domain and an HTH DNA-binding domain [Herbaspirillum sp. CF444]
MSDAIAVTNIMIVDDHPMIREGLRVRLESVPSLRVVAEAGGADEALAHAARHDVHLVLMDINLRGMNGIELTAAFHAMFPGIAVLILSMHDKAEYVMQSIRAGARGYILKDAPGNDIVRAIETVLSGGIYYSAALIPMIARPRMVDESLTAREYQVLEQIAIGASNRKIAKALDLSIRTVETHCLNIKRKLNIEGRSELIKFALEHLPKSGA